MKLKKEFIDTLAKAGEAMLLLCANLGMPREQLVNRVQRGQAFDYEESKTIINTLGAETMIPLIDWEGTNARGTVC